MLPWAKVCQRTNGDDYVCFDLANDALPRSVITACSWISADKRQEELSITETLNNPVCTDY